MSVPCVCYMFYMYFICKLSLSCVLCVYHLYHAYIMLPCSYHVYHVCIMCTNCILYYYVCNRDYYHLQCPSLCQAACALEAGTYTTDTATCTMCFSRAKCVLNVHHMCFRCTMTVCLACIPCVQCPCPWLAGRAREAGTCTTDTATSWRRWDTHGSTPKWEYIILILLYVHCQNINELFVSSDFIWMSSVVLTRSQSQVNFS